MQSHRLRVPRPLHGLLSLPGPRPFPGPLLLLMFMLVPAPVLVLVPESVMASRPAASGLTPGPSGDESQDAERYCEIRVVDDATGRGIPLVALRTVHNVTHVTDNAGRIALPLDDYAGQRVFFHIDAPGYDVPKDGFGMEGVRLTIAAGQTHEVALPRINLAERLYRITGQGRFRDSRRLGYAAAGERAPRNGQVAGQDSVQAVVYRHQIRWFWGDTSRLTYPLGLFRTAGAVTPLPEQGRVSAAEGYELQYFVGDDGFARAVADVSDSEGVVWVDGVCTVRDSDGEPRMVAHYSRRPGLAQQYEHGILIWNDEGERFDIGVRRELSDSWRFPHSHPVVAWSNAAGTLHSPTQTNATPIRYLYCGHPVPAVRVPATLDAVLDPDAWESLTCRASGDNDDQATPERLADGSLAWRWAPAEPVDQHDEARWLREQLVTADELRMLPRDVERPDHRVLLHGGSVHWNAWRRTWVLIAIEQCRGPDCPSLLGEVWYAESDAPVGPFRLAQRIVTHDRQSFYNPCHHAFFDEEGGRVIYFEGTYCNTFTDAPPTPRYNYNQVLYRLDLSHPGLTAVRETP